jgi:hypothetical protein
MITRYVAHTRIARIEERFEKRHRPGSGTGKDAVVDSVSTGWWIVTMAPEPYAFCAGSSRPDHEVGATIRLAIEVKE